MRRAKRSKRVARKLHAAKQYGNRIAPRSLLAPLRFYNLYGYLADNTRLDYNNAGIALKRGETYLRTYNLSSIFDPDPLNDDSGTGSKSVFAYTEYQPHYTKWLVRATKVRAWFYAICQNGENTANNTPISVWLWCDNVNHSNTITIDTNSEAFVQQGRKVLYVPCNTYNPGTRYFKRFYSAKKVLKRKLDEAEDYGVMTKLTNDAAGVDPNEDACMFLHMLFINNANGPTDTDVQPVNISWAMDFTMYTKFWDSTIDTIDTVNPDED